MSLIIPDLDRAIPLGKRVLALRTELLGADDEQTIDSLTDLAGVLEEAGEYAESETLQREAIERGTRSLGPNHPLVLNSMSALALALKPQEKLAEAAELERLVYAKKREILGPDDIQVLVVATNLADTLFRMDETQEEGELLLQNTLTAKQHVLGPDHRETLVSANNLVHHLERFGRVEEALAICDAAVATSEGSPRIKSRYAAQIVDLLRSRAQSLRTLQEEWTSTRLRLLPKGNTRSLARSYERGF